MRSHLSSPSRLSLAGSLSLPLRELRSLGRSLGLCLGLCLACTKPSPSEPAKAQTEEQSAQPSQPKRPVKPAAQPASPAPTQVSLSPEGSTFDPPIKPEALPSGAHYCDMGTVHYARAERGDGLCPLCKMKLSHKP